MFYGSEIATESAEKVFEVKNRGLLSYKIKGAQLSVRFIFLPLWAGALIALAAIVAVAFIFRKKLAVLLKPLADKLFKNNKTRNKTKKK